MTNMARKIIYPNGNGGICVVYPTGELPIDQVALKDVPAGLPYLIVDDSDIPTDDTFFGAWTADFSNPHGHGIGHYAWAAQQAQSQEGGDVDNY